VKWINRGAKRKNSNSNKLNLIKISVMKRNKYITPSKKEKRETKVLLINGYVTTLVKLDERYRPEACYMGMRGWALQEIIKMKRENKPIPKMRRTR
jgi:hypothetical protein